MKTNELHSISQWSNGHTHFFEKAVLVVEKLMKVFITSPLITNALLVQNTLKKKNEFPIRTGCVGTQEPSFQLKKKCSINTGNALIIIR